MSDFGTLWLYRPLINWLDIYRWGIEDGFPLMFIPSSLHISLASIRHKTDISNLPALNTNQLVIEGGQRSVKKLGKNGAQCLEFESQELIDRHRELAGLLPIDHADEGLRPHITLCRHRRQTFEPRKAYEGPLIFGPEVQGVFVPNFRVSQRSVNGNDVRKLLGLPLHADRSLNPRANDQEVIETQARERKQARIREDLDDVLGDDPSIRGKLLRRL